MAARAAALAGSHSCVAVPENYRRAYMIGTQLAEYVSYVTAPSPRPPLLFLLRAVWVGRVDIQPSRSTIEDNDTPLPYVEFDYREQDAFVRVTNFLFRGTL